MENPNPAQAVIEDTPTSPEVTPDDPASSGPAGESQEAPEQQGTRIEDVDRLQSELDRARADAAKYRTKLREAEDFRKKVLGAVGDDDDTDDPAQVAERLTTELRNERIQNALLRVAGQTDADVDLLVPYLHGSGLLADLNGTDDRDALETQIRSIVTRALETVPRLRKETKGPPAANSGPAPSGKGSARRFSRDEIAKMTPAELEANREAIDEWVAAGQPGL